MVVIVDFRGGRDKSERRDGEARAFEHVEEPEVHAKGGCEGGENQERRRDQT